VRSVPERPGSQAGAKACPAAVCDGALNALACLRRAGLKKGQTIFIYGVSGSIGTAAVQSARYFGADATAVCSTKNLDLARSLGASRSSTIWPKSSSATARPTTSSATRSAHIRSGVAKARSSGGGIYLSADGWRNLALALRPTWAAGQKVMLAIPPWYARHDVLFLKRLIEAGKYRAVIDRRYPLERVAEAARYVETQQKTGNVVLTINRSRSR
jgi:NADPH:quinone reductase-like Zn-dependent oxidoreductase